MGHVHYWGGVGKCRRVPCQWRRSCGGGEAEGIVGAKQHLSCPPALVPMQLQYGVLWTVGLGCGGSCSGGTEAICGSSPKVENSPGLPLLQGLYLKKKKTNQRPWHGVIFRDKQLAISVIITRLEAVENEKHFLGLSSSSLCEMQGTFPAVYSHLFLDTKMRYRIKSRPNSCLKKETLSFPPVLVLNIQNLFLKQYVVSPGFKQIHLQPCAYQHYLIAPRTPSSSESKTYSSIISEWEKVSYFRNITMVV